MKIAVIGAGGFVGVRVAARLVEDPVSGAILGGSSSLFVLSQTVLNP